MNLTFAQMHQPVLRCRRNKKGGIWAFFTCEKDGEERVDYSASTRGRRVAKRFVDVNGDTKFWHHEAATLRFIRFGFDQAWYLTVQPGHHYTLDGFKTSKFTAEKESTMKRIERNAAVRTSVSFWAKYFSPVARLTDEADRPIRLGGPARVETDRGWSSPAPPSDESQVDVAEGNDLRLFGLS